MGARRWLSVACTLGFALAAERAAAQSAKAPHGALAMSEQEKRLDKLSLGGSSGAPPARVTPSTWAATIPADNALTPERVALGRKLFFDPRLSADGTVACATCHDVSRGFTDQRPVAEGIGGKLGRRNAPTVLNAMFFTSQFWDGRAALLEDQAKLPILNPIEMGMPNGDAVIAKIGSDSDYVKMFQAAYSRAPSYDDVGRAIGAFERTLVFLDAPFDRWQDGDSKAMSADAVKGFALFSGKARCVACHPINASSPIGSDNRFHNIGVSARHQDFESLAGKALAELAKGGDSQQVLDRLALETDLSELGRFLVTKRRSDVGSFKTQQLRNVAVTAPYMHDGSMQTLWDVMDHYNKGGEANPYLDGGIEPLALSDEEVDQVVELLFTMTDRRLGDENAREMTRQHDLAATQRPFRDTALAMRKVLPFEQRLQKEK